METVKPEVETSGFVEVFTTVLPFFLLLIIGMIVVAIVYIVKIVKHHIANGKIEEQKLKMVEENIREIKQSLDRIEKTLSKVE